MDPLIRLLEPDAPRECGPLLAAFRDRLAGFAWESQTASTPMSPVWSTASSTARFEQAVLAVFRAHLKLLHALRADLPGGGAWHRYAALEEVVRHYLLDWPALPADEPAPEDLLDPECARRYIYGRPDIVISPDGPKLVETNFDTSVGGYERPDAIWAIAAELFAPPATLLRTGRPADGLREYFLELAGGRPADIHWIMPDDPRIAAAVEPFVTLLDDHSHHVHHTVHYPGQPVPDRPGDPPGWLHRSCAIFTVNRDRERFAALLTALAPSAPRCTMPVSLSHLDSKLFLAWLSDRAARPASLTPAEHNALDALLPWTRVLALLDPEQLAHVRVRREEFVLKKADSYQGRDVYFGCNLGEREWWDMLKTRRDEPEALDGISNIWIIQRRVRPRLFELPEYTDDGVRVRETGLSCCPYILGGRLRGLETWITPLVPDHAMLGHMQFVPHFIEAADGQTRSR